MAADRKEDVLAWPCRRGTPHRPEGRGKSRSRVTNWEFVQMAVLAWKVFQRCSRSRIF